MSRSSAIAVWAGAALTAALLFSQAPRAAAPQAFGELKGQVFNASTGEPLPKAEVVLTPVGGGVGSNFPVGADGSFDLKSAAPGRYHLFAQRTGFVNQGYGAPASASDGGTELEVVAGQAIEGLRIKMTPQGVIAGRVLDADGDPIQGANMALWRYEYPDGEKQLVRQPFGSPGTNDLGEYRFAGLPPGLYIVSATTRLPSPRDGKAAESGPVPTYYPRSPDPKSAAAIPVAAGTESRGIDIQVLNSRLFQIRGSVSGVPASPPEAATGRGGRGEAGASRVSVLIQSLDSAALARSGTVSADGTFVVAGVAPGSYVLQGRMPNPPNDPLAAFEEVEVTSRDAEGVTLRLLPPLKLAGSVSVDAPGSPAPKLTSVRVNFRPAVTGMVGGTGVAKADGTFPLQVFSGAYRMEAAGIPDGYYLKTIKLAGREVPDGMFDFTSGGVTGSALELMLAPTSGVLAGTVNNAKGEPVAGARVTVVPSSGSLRRDLYQSKYSDSNGGFTFKGLPPGKYRVYGWQQVDTNAWMKAEFRKPYEDSAGVAELTDTGTVNVMVTLIEH